MLASWTDSYCDVEKIGQGAFGDVMRGRPKTGDREANLVALKVVNLRAVAEEAVRKRLTKEAELMIQFDHWSIVKLHTYFHDEPNGMLYLEMEYCPDGDLAKAIADQNGQQFSEAQVRNWFAQLALAIQNLQEKFKLVHRDIKPLNIFLMENKSLVKLGDFGISKILNEIRMSTTAGLTLGTLQYMSPQALSGENSTFADDIWSLGVVLFQLATLQLPFTGGANPTAVSMYLEIQKGKWSCEIDSLSETLKKLLQDLLQVEPEKRPTIGQVVGCDFLKPALDEALASGFAAAAKQKKNLLSDTEKKNLEDEITRLRQQLGQTKLEAASNVSDLEKELFEACSRGETDRARSILLSKKVDVNVRYDNARHGIIDGKDEFLTGDTCLIFAAWGGNVETVRMLVKEFNAKVDLQDENGWTALNSAADGGELEIIKILREDGKANLEARCEGEMTALILAAKNGSYEILEYLLKHGAKPNKKDADGKTALSYAETQDVKQLLKRHGATT